MQHPWPLRAEISKHNFGASQQLLGFLDSIIWKNNDLSPEGLRCAAMLPTTTQQAAALGSRDQDVLGRERPGPMPRDPGETTRKSWILGIITPQLMDNWDNWILIGTILHHGYTWNKSPSPKMKPCRTWSSRRLTCGTGARATFGELESWPYTARKMIRIHNDSHACHAPWGKHVSCSHFQIIQLWCFILAIQSNYCWSVGWWF